MTAYNPYPVYRPSDVDWLGDLPIHWEQRRLKFVAPPATAKLSEKPTDKTYLGLENVESGTGRLLLDSPTESVESVVTVFQPDDVLFGKLRPYLAKVVHADFEGVCTGELMVLRPLNHLLHSRFLFYLMLSHGFINIVDSMTYGAKMPRANPNHVVNLPISLPSLVEQQAIAAFLDRETVWLDTLIAKKRELIDLLHKQRTAVISHAVTKGLNPHASLKSSSIEWLGDVPAHWEVRRLKFLASVNPSKVEVSHLADDLYVSFLPMERIGNGTFDLELKRPLKEVRQGLTYFRDGDVIIAKITPSFENGKGVLAWGLENGIGFGTTELHVIRASNMFDRRYVYYLTLTHQFRGMGETQMFGTAGQKRVPDSFINDFPTPLPPLAEQRAIVDFLDHEISRIDDLTAKIETSIALLQKQRTAIISAAVTGKIDVRSQELD